MNIAVITGASSGIGREFVLKADKKFKLDEIWVIARRAERLNELKSLTNAKIKPIPLDLTADDAIEQYKSELDKVKPNVKLLVNAGGFGKFGAFCDIPLSEQYNMIDLNCKALVGVTYATVPFMTSSSNIIEMSSISAFQPVPYINVYAATKSFVLSFSRSLGVELKKKNIKVTAVCPFWVKTEFFDRAVTDDTVKYYARFLTAENVVKAALKDAEKGKAVSICGFVNKCQALAAKILPHGLVMKIWCRQQGK